jgi:ubiquinone/menaquinone biosynthesis C-methylase UbiE
MSTHNLMTYSGALTTRDYAKVSDLQVPEEVILSDLASEFSDRRILDIGVGGGRTTPHLCRISKDYLGIDYSARMIERCRARFPSVAFAVHDARDLSGFDDGSFDLAMFSFNGIDYMGHEDRLKALNGIYRILAQNGAFVFSSHNRERELISAWSVKHLLPDANPFSSPLHLARKLITYPVGIIHRAMNARYEEDHEEYAIYNDDAHNYSLMTYHISVRNQIKQVREIGFRDIRAVGLDGRWLREDELSRRHDDAWIYYVCRR